MFEPVNQISRARNSGAAAATGDWLVFVDADSHPSAGLFADMAKEIQSGKCIAGGATIRWDQKQIFIIELIDAGGESRIPLAAIALRRYLFSSKQRRFENSAVSAMKRLLVKNVELSRRLKKLARKPESAFSDSASASGRDLRAQNAALHNTPATRTVRTPILHNVRSIPRHKKPRSRSHMVWRTEVAMRFEIQLARASTAARQVARVGDK